MYHLSTQHHEWLFTGEKLKELRTKANADYVQKQVDKRREDTVGNRWSSFCLIRR